MTVETKSKKINRWVRRITFVVVLVMLYFFLRTYWYAVVPPGMDTLPELYPQARRASSSAIRAS